MGDADREPAHYMVDSAEGAESHQREAFDLIDGSVVVVLIDSPTIGGLIWFDFSDGRHPDQGDSTPIFFASDLPSLRKMTEAELRRHYELKRTLGGGWVRDKIAEPTKH